ncbi:MAG TPA: hypothetical protein VMF52_05255 [Steroidobacteraceae bacterium]|nr:hypothetical protein [Steroidobacteraceae bacterium]
MSTPPLDPLPDLIDECLDEAAFLWQRWEAELTSAQRNLDEIWQWTEDRLAGALDGVRVASDAQLEPLLAGTMASDDAFRQSALASALATSPARNARHLLANAVRDATGAQLAACLRGIEVANIDGSFSPVAKVLSASGPEHSAALCRLKAFRRATLGPELAAAFESRVVSLQVEVMRAARHLPPEYVGSWIDTGLKHDHAAVRAAAIESGIARRVPNAWSAALEYVRQPRAESSRLLPLVAMLGGPAEHQLILDSVMDAGVQRAALWSLGHIGTRDAAETCLLAMKNPKLARLGGEAYCTITGANLERDKLTAPEPEEPPPAFEQDDLDANLVPRPEDLWPLPDPQLVRRHWDGIAPRFQPGRRHLRGLPHDGQAMLSAIVNGPMLRRPDHVFEMFVRSEGRFDVEPRASVPVQKTMIASSQARLTTAGT